jgi:hypothetical protein
MITVFRIDGDALTALSGVAIQLLVGDLFRRELHDANRDR